VTIKLIAPAIDEIPAKCKEKILTSTAEPECAYKLDNGGYNVQPVPTPASIKLDKSSKHKEGGSNQKDTLFKRGNAISTLPSIKGTNQLPHPPIITGITIKKIIINACAVTITLYR